MIDMKQKQTHNRNAYSVTKLLNSTTVIKIYFWCRFLVQFIIFTILSQDCLYFAKNDVTDKLVLVGPIDQIEIMKAIFYVLTIACNQLLFDHWKYFLNVHNKKGLMLETKLKGKNHEQFKNVFESNCPAFESASLIWLFSQSCFIDNWPKSD